MLKSAIGILMNKEANHWVVDILRSVDDNGVRRSKIGTTLYFKNFKCDILGFNQTINVKDVIKISYKKVSSKNLLSTNKTNNGNDRANIIIYDVRKLEIDTLTGDLGIKTMPDEKLPVVVVAKKHIKDVYIIWNANVDDIPKNCDRKVAINYAVLDPDDFDVDLLSYTYDPNVHYHLVCVVTIHMTRKENKVDDKTEKNNKETKDDKVDKINKGHNKNKT